MTKRTKNGRRAERDQMNDLYRTWAQNRWPVGMPDQPDWNDVETAFQAGFHLALTEGAPGVKASRYCHECMVNVTGPCQYKGCPVGVTPSPESQEEKRDA